MYSRCLDDGAFYLWIVQYLWSDSITSTRLFSLNWSYCMLAALRSNKFGWEGLISLSLHLFERFWEQGLHSLSTFFSLLLSALAFLALQFYSSPLILLFWSKLADFSDLKVDWRYARDFLLRAVALRRVWRSQEKEDLVPLSRYQFFFLV